MHLAYTSVSDFKVIMFLMCKSNICSYILSLVCLGIVREYSLPLIASLRTYTTENPVSSQGASVCPGYHPHIFEQALRVAEDRLCLCLYDSHERV